MALRLTQTVHIVMLLLAALVIKQSAGAISSCTFDDSICGCQTDQGPINLKTYENTRFQADSSDSTYFWNPCKDFTAGSVTAACIQQQGSDRDAYDYDCGIHSSTTSKADGGNAVFMMTANDGQRQSVLTCICGSSEKFSFTSEDPQATYNLQLTSNYCCPGYTGASTGLSVGSILLILFFSLIVAYVLVGVLVQVFVRKADGRERVPNIAFWSLLPGLVIDGFRFTFSCFGRRSSVYGSI